MRKLSVRDLDVRGRRVLVRVDFNVPRAADGTITSDARIAAALPTVRLLLDNGAAVVVLASHLGKPKGKVVPALGLAPVARRAGELLGRPVLMAPDCIGADAARMVETAPAGGVVLLENLRFHPGEEADDPEFAAALAALADRYVNDAFGTAHRRHASTCLVPTRFERPAAGLLVEKEIHFLSEAVEHPEPPYVLVIGGAKASDKAGVIVNLLPRVDRVLVGGGAVFSFLRGRDIPTGKSLLDPDVPPQVQHLHSDKLVLPSDFVVAPSPHEPARARVVPVDGIPDDEMALDIGPATARSYADELERARTVVWAGPMGVFETDAFARGTEAVGRAIAAATDAGATTVVGGGDTAAALDRFGLADRVSHASTGGSACLKFLEGKPLPGIEALKDA